MKKFSSMWPEESLIVQAKLDSKAMGQSLAMLHRLVYSWAWIEARAIRSSGRSLSATESVDDLASDGIVTAIGAIRSFDPSRGVPYQKWVKLCVQRKWRDSRSREGRRVALSRDLLDQHEAGGGTDRLDTLFDVGEILGKMDHNDSRLLKVCYGLGVERKTVREVAADLGTSVGSAHGRLSAARNKFREMAESNQQSEPLMVVG